MQAAAKIDSKIMSQQLIYVKITEIVQVPIVCYTQPRPQGFSVKKWVGRPTHFLREKPWGRGCAAQPFLVSSCS